MLQGFKNFILRGNVLDLAVGVIIGAAFNGVVQALVKDLLTPIIGIFGKTGDFSTLTFTIRGSVFMYGDFINNLISFVLVAAAVYFFVIVPMNKVMERFKKAPAEPAAPPVSTTEKLLTEIRDLLKK